MSFLQIKLADDLTSFSPGETISGAATWQLDNPPQEAKLDLVWSTQGKGTTDFDVVQTVPFAQPQSRDSRPFSFRLPEAPYSFSGQLISLIWNLELNIQPGDLCEALEIVIAPDRAEVLLPRIKPAK